MLATRVIVALLLLPFGLGAIFYSSIAFAALWTVVLALAAWEYVVLFRAGRMQPAGILVVGGVVLLASARTLTSFETAALLLSLLVLLSMTYHLFQYEWGRNEAATDFGITLAGVLYLGWVGAYLISLRDLPQGEWWLLLVLFSVWCTDSGAYLAGHRFGRHRLSNRLSPKKTWEGYWGGAAAGLLGGLLFAWLYGQWTAAGALTIVNGGVLGLALGLLTVFGDLGESMMKRQVGAKDSGKLLPGHGGIFDRIDSWLWAGVIGYYLVLLFLVL